MPKTDTLRCPSKWSQPYHGVTHMVPDRRREWPRQATVTELRASVSMLSYSYTTLEHEACTHGYGFFPFEALFPSVEEAKQAGEAWVRDGKYPAEHDNFYDTRP